MKKILFVLAVVSAVLFVGCKKTEPAKSAVDMSKMNETAHQTADQTQKAAEKAVAAVTEQTVCPVMAGNPIDKKIFVEYKGKKVYFCCQACVAEFNKESEKYIKDLPQFKQ